MTVTIERGQLCANPKIAHSEGVSLPKVDNIERPFTWTPISDLIGRDSVDFYDGLSDENLDTKRGDIDYALLVESIRNEGILNPVFWDEFTYGNGHHRLAACIDLGYTHIPTTANPQIEWEESGVTTRIDWTEYFS